MSHEIRELEKDLLSARTARDVAWREAELLRSEANRLRAEQAERPRGDVPAPGQACPICRGPLVEQDGHTVCQACSAYWWSVDNFCPIPGPAMDGHLAPAAIVLHSGEPGPRELHLFARLEDARAFAADGGGEVIRISRVGWHGAGEGEGGGA